MPTAEELSLDLAADVLRAIGSSVSERTVFGDGHPRFEESLARLEAEVGAFLGRNPGSPSITFLLNGRQAEFRKVPIVNPGYHGDRAVRAIIEAGFEGLRIRLPITRDDLRVLIRSLRDPRGREGPPAAEGANFQLLAADEARGLRRGAGIASAAEAGAGGADPLLVPEFEVSEDSCRSILATCRLIVTNREGGISIDSARLDETSHQVLDLFKGSDALASPRLARSYFDDYTFHHSVNVCLIATSVASTMVKDEALLRSISKAALLHDVGKREIPAEIIHKPGKLTPEEFEVVQKHPSYGAEILLAVDGIDPLCVAVAYGHHMQSGPGSYPKTRRILRPGWITQLISVVDIYEALTAVRPYKKGLSPETAFRILFSMAGVQDRLPLLKLLYDALGRYPVGTYVELSTGERAVVVGQNLSAPDRPRVRVLTDADRSPLAAPREVNLVKEGGLAVRRSIVAQTVRADPLRDDPDEATDILGEPLGDTRVLMAREG